MGYSLQDFCRDAREVLKTGSSLRIDAVTGKIERIRARQTGAAAAR